MKLLYLCINDGSDTRINKEINSLSTHYQIYYLGIGQDETQAFAKARCADFQLVKGQRRSVITWLKYYRTFLRIYFSRRYESIHVINEQLLLIFWPFLWWNRRRVVADIFDSIFLKTNSPFIRALQSLVYRLPKCIIVTDDNRKSLVPSEFLSKTSVVENYPYRFDDLQPKKSKANELLILYSGSLGVTRGTQLLNDLLDVSPDVRVWLVGWLYDEPTKALAQHSRATYLGVLPQQEVMRRSSECDYILSLYEPINDNNLNASPNKIYDAIQAQTPVIINSEVKVARFVAEQGVGYVMPSFYETNPAQLLENLIRKKGHFEFDTTLKERYTWEAIESKLLAAHLTSSQIVR